MAVRICNDSKRITETKPRELLAEADSSVAMLLTYHKIHVALDVPRLRANMKIRCDLRCQNTPNQKITLSTPCTPWHQPAPNKNTRDIEKVFFCCTCEDAVPHVYGAGGARCLTVLLNSCKSRRGGKSARKSCVCITLVLAQLVCESYLNCEELDHVVTQPTCRLRLWHDAGMWPHKAIQPLSFLLSQNSVPRHETSTSRSMLGSRHLVMPVAQENVRHGHSCCEEMWAVTLNTMELREAQR
jgi:hypothetical protein